MKGKITQQNRTAKFVLCWKQCAIFVLGLCGSLQLAQAQSAYPDRAITIVVPFAAGGAFDAQARVIGQVMNESLKQPVVVDNLSGAGGVIGATRIAKAAPDGYNLLLGSLGPNAAAKALNDNLSYAPRSDFKPIALLSRASMVLVVRKDLPVKNFAELLKYAKDHPLTAGSAGVGSISHVALVLFGKVTGVKADHIPYRGLPQSMNDLLAGRIDMMFDQVITATPHLRGDKVMALAVTSSERVVTFPDIPTTAELGYAGINVVAWGALFAPKNTPDPIIEILNKAAKIALADPRVVKTFTNLGADIPPSGEQTPAALGLFLNAEINKWEPLLEAAQ